MPGSGKKNQAAAAPPITGGSPTVTTINQAISLIVQANQMVDNILRGPFTPKENSAMFKGRHSVKVLAPVVIKEAVAKPNLAPNNITPAQMQEQLAVAEAFVQFSNKVSAVNGRVGDTSRSMQSDLVTLALDIYVIAERNTMDPDAQILVSQMKEALANGPRFPRKKVTTLPKPVTMHVPAEAAAAAQAAVDAQQAASTGTSTTGSTSSTPATPTSAPTVPVYAPGGQVGTAPATNGGGSPHS